jgi:translation initiation factor IF-3
MYSFFYLNMEVFRIAKQSEALINEQINFKEVIVIGPNGEKMGLKSIEDARTLASYAGLDLVLMTSSPQPVCKIIDYNKYRYEKRKKEKDQRKKQMAQNLEVKEYRLSVTIDVHDFETKLRNATAYLQKGHKVKVTIKFKGRQIAHPELGRDVILRFCDRLEGIAIKESEPKLEGRSMGLTLAPIK